MPIAVTSVDYFLFDNQTPAPLIGRDWGIKAETGQLARFGALRRAFERYCRSIAGESGQIRAFGAAIGGIRYGVDGYLLCVTLETNDHIGRPSWATIGLWCATSEELSSLLREGDPIASARDLLAAATLPGSLDIRLGTRSSREKVQVARRGSTVLRFRPASSPGIALGLLLGQANRRLPQILGITSSARLEDLADKGFDVVFCHPADERTEQALARIESSVLPIHDDEDRVKPPDQTEMPYHGPSFLSTQHEAIGARMWRGMSHGVRALVDAFHDADRWVEPTLTVFIVVALLLIGTRWFLLLPQMDSPGPPDGQVKEEELWRRLVAELEQVHKLEPMALQESAGFTTAEKIEVIAARTPEREQVRAAYKRLLSIGAWIRLTYDFVQGLGSDVPVSHRLAGLSAILQPDRVSGKQECQVLKSAFGFEFAERRPVVAWCSALEGLEDLFTTLHPKPQDSR